MRALSSSSDVRFGVRSSTLRLSSAKRGRHHQLQAFRGLEVERELELGWCLHRQLGWVRALKDAVHVSRRAAEYVERVRPVGHQPTVGGEATIDAQRRKAMLLGELSIAFEQHHVE